MKFIVPIRFYLLFERFFNNLRGWKFQNFMVTWSSPIIFLSAKVVCTANVICIELFTSELSNSLIIPTSVLGLPGTIFVILDLRVVSCRCNEILSTWDYIQSLFVDNSFFSPSFYIMSLNEIFRSSFASSTTGQGNRVHRQQSLANRLTIAGI